MVAQFTQGPPIKHVAVMTGASTLSLLALFIVDFVDMFFLSLLGEVELAAAIGYAGSILFFTTSISIGLSIGTGALVAQALGRDDITDARHSLVNGLAAGLILTIPATVAIWVSVPTLLSLLGATGRAHALATVYLQIIVPSMPILAIAMAANGALRAVGDARRSMIAMVAGGLANALLDPLLIFGLGPVPALGVSGAAIASVGARLTIFALSLHYVIGTHGLIAPFNRRVFRTDLPRFLRIALPATLTNIATPIGNAYVVASLAAYGTGAVAGGAIISRIAPVAFSALFALSGAIGPIIGQNFGAGLMERVKQTLRDAFLLIGVYVLVVWLLLYLGRDHLVSLFSADQQAGELLILFCTWIAASYAFNGVSFATNAAFNNLNLASLATLFNFAKATIGTMPFVYFGGQWAGANGVLFGQAVGAVVFGIIGAICAFAITNRLARRQL